MILDDKKPSPTELGYAAYAAALDKQFYDKEMGAIYDAAATTFRLWTPVATEVSVCLYTTGSDSEEGAQKISTHKMNYTEKYGIWRLTLSGNYKNLYYTYLVTVNGETHEVVDPYAKAVGVNGNRGMIVDLADTDPEGWAEDNFKRVDYGTEAVVWEVSVRDFSASESSGVTEKNRGKYLAFTELQTTLNNEGDIPTCVSYLKELGVNYVQINPFYDFASIDEIDTFSEQYNWGYDPKNYNVPEGSYSSNPYDGRVRIRECKEMIKALHEAGIGVIMDVVYNHTYYSENSFFNQIAPYYYYRMNEDGSWSNGSGCGNDVATERYMVRRFIRDSVTYWAQEYHIDGFRFDLMGLMDVTTMNSIRKALDKLTDGDKILMYGEAWKMNTAAPADVKLANQDNMSLLSKRIGAFNDTARDAIKGSVFSVTDTGFVQEGKSKAGVRSAIDADGGGWAAVPNQCVNYSSCHDNLTLYDKLTGSVYKDDGYRRRREDLVAMNRLSAAIILMSRGMPFMLAGEEMARTKRGDENSYISPVAINQIDWNNLTQFASLTDYYKGLIAIRSAVGIMNDPTGSRSTLSYLETEGKGAVAFTASGEGYASIAAVFNGNPDESVTVTLPEGKWVILADGNRAGLAFLGAAEGTLTVPSTSAAVLIDADSYAALSASDDEAVVYVRYVDKETSEVFYEQKASGAIGDTYALNGPQNVLYAYDISEGQSSLSGTFEEPFKTVSVICKKFEGDFSSITFKYTDDTDRLLADSIVLTGRAGQKYYAPATPAVSGYRLDLSRLPEHAAGTFGKDSVEVVFRYITDDGTATPDEISAGSRANLIYMDNNGKVLQVKTVFGTAGDRIVYEASFEGCDYHSVTEENAVFAEYEKNILVFYTVQKSPVLIYVLAAGAVLLLIGVIVFIYLRSGKRRKMNAIEIEE